MRIVLDTNVLIDGFNDSYSFAKRIIDEVSAGKLQAFANSQTIRENRLILGRLIKDDRYRREMESFFDQIVKVENRRTVSVVVDPEDNKILESAVESGAEYLITRDNDLLAIGQYDDVKIVEPGTFWAVYSDDDDGLWRQWTNYVTKRP